MSGFWSKLGEKIVRFLVWALDNHPGKLIGTSVGFFLGFLIVTLGFWHTLVVALFVSLGFVIGKRQDEQKTITAWLERILNKY